MEGERANIAAEQEKKRLELEKAQEKAKSFSKVVKEIKQKLQTAKEERDALNTDYQQLLKEKSQLEFHVTDLQKDVKGDSKSKVLLTYIFL